MGFLFCMMASQKLTPPATGGRSGESPLIRIREKADSSPARRDRNDNVYEYSVDDLGQRGLDAFWREGNLSDAGASGIEDGVSDRRCNDGDGGFSGSGRWHISFGVDENRLDFRDVEAQRQR